VEEGRAFAKKKKEGVKKKENQRGIFTSGTVCTGQEKAVNLLLATAITMRSKEGKDFVLGRCVYPLAVKKERSRERKRLTGVGCVTDSDHFRGGE